MTRLSDITTVTVATEAQATVARKIATQANTVRTRLAELQQWTNAAVEDAAAGSTMPIQLAQAAATVDRESAALYALVDLGRTLGIAHADLTALAKAGYWVAVEVAEAA